MTIDQAREKVARGAALLDRERPGWAEEIDCGRLDLQQECRCVLGQLHGQFSDGADRLFHGDYPDRPHSVAHGFFTWGSVKSYRVLQDAWVEAIAARVVPAEQPALVNA